MQNNKREEQSDSAYEVSVIGLADAVIDPQTVVVEHIHTPVALATVFWAVADVSRAYLAHEVVIVSVERNATLLASSLLGDGWVSRIFESGSDPEPQTHEAH